MIQQKLAFEGPNAGQIEYWNAQAGPRWVSAEALLDAQLSDIGQRAMERAEVAGGHHVLDVGCGCGQSSLQLAERAGPEGSVTGIDISSVMLARARERAAGWGNVCFENADVQTAELPTRHFDRIFSRFGVMFFNDPKAAFRNLHAACKPGGRLGFLCWQEIARNDWIRVPTAAAAQHLTLPPPPSPEAPGPFAFADPERVCGILASAGFHDVAWGPLEQPLSVGGGADVDATAQFLLNLGPLGRVMAEVDDATRERVIDAIRDSLAPYATASGVRMDSAAWVFTANA